MTDHHDMSFTERVRKLIATIPPGQVATYGQIATHAGNPRAARQVVRVLHSSTDKYHLPWHRVINSKGQIGLKPGQGYELQRAMLIDEGVAFDEAGRIDLKRYLWSP